jgi:hypothetical protein
MIATMTCSSCGAYVPPSVRFCSNCGAPASDPEATRIARLQSRALEFNGDQDLEHTVFTVRPTMIFIKAGYALAVVSGIALVFLLASLGVPASISIPLALALLLIPAYYHIRRNMVRYTVTDSKLQIDKGLIARETKNIPLSKVQDVDSLGHDPAAAHGFWRHRYRQRQRDWRLDRHAQHQQASPLRRPSFARTQTLALN